MRDSLHNSVSSDGREPDRDVKNETRCRSSRKSETRTIATLFQISKRTGPSGYSRVSTVSKRTSGDEQGAQWIESVIRRSDLLSLRLFFYPHRISIGLNNHSPPLIGAERLHVKLLEAVYHFRMRMPIPIFLARRNNCHRR